MTNVINVGDKVLVHGKIAVVRYDGPVNVKKKTVPKGAFIGVEFLKSPAGKHDGTIEGKRYFSCKHGYGLFIRPDFIRPFSEKEFAATRIQALYKGVRARRELEHKVSFQFWNALESMEESEALSENKSVGSQVEKSIKRQIREEELQMMGSSDSLGDDSPKRRSLLEVGGVSRRGSTMGGQRKSIARLSIDPSALQQEEIPPDYKGPHLKWPVDRQFALDVVDHMREHPDVPLPRRYAFDMLIKIEDLMRAESPGAVYHMCIPKKASAKLVIVGDTHGQLNDVLWLFYKFGAPSSTNVYLFNGDICDRGVYGCEIFLILFAFKLSCPESVFINRGNHESSDMNEVYGFAQEVMQKYGGQVYTKFQDIFHAMPLCAVVENRVLVVHGGLSRKEAVCLRHINGINRARPCPANPSTVEDFLMFDLLWSDPQKEIGRGHTRYRPT
eukprot:GHVN01019634.1.p1 GENE.GHVN01019634.1~~GHVN01019634.1.p1  ORF type:complete len:443 (+),score=47.41 GHVN01019634.1:93-1421(+)